MIIDGLHASIHIFTSKSSLPDHWTCYFESPLHYSSWYTVLFSDSLRLYYIMLIAHMDLDRVAVCVLLLNRHWATTTCTFYKSFPVKFCDTTMQWENTQFLHFASRGCSSSVTQTLECRGNKCCAVYWFSLYLWALKSQLSPLCF